MNPLAVLISPKHAFEIFVVAILNLFADSVTESYFLI